MARRSKKFASHLEYNRPSKGYKKNLAKGELKDAALPSMDSIKRMIKALKILLMIWVILTVWAVIVRGLKGFIVWVVIALLISPLILMYVNHIDKKVIKAYKNLGIPKEAYLKELEKSGKMSERRMKKLNAMWDKTQ